MQNWLPALDGVVSKLERGAKVADIGCGTGQSTFIMARAFPSSTFVGYDFHPPSIEHATAYARTNGAENIRFEVARAKDFPARDLDLVTCFDVLHDLGDPVGAATHIHRSLKPDGTWMLMEPLAGDAPKVFRSGRDFAAWIGIVPRQEFDRWQTETGADLETRRPISETHSGGRSPCGVEAGTPPTGEVSVGHTASRTQTVQGRGGGSCQQDGARRLGVVGQGRQLSSACACGSGVRVCREQSEFAFVRIWTAGVMTTLMRNGRDRRSGKPVMGHAILERALLVGTRSADHIRASGHSGCIATGRASTRKNRPHTWLHPNDLQNRSDSSCTAGAVHTWPIATNFSLGPDVSFRGEAEMGERQSSPPRSKLTRRRHRRLKITAYATWFLSFTQAHLHRAQTSWRQPARKESSPGAAASNRMDSSTSSANGTER